VSKAARPWTDEERELVRSSPSTDTTVLAEKLGRTYQAVANLRFRMKSGIRHSTADYDIRPSGWYEETIGQMLIECEDAFSAWKHYHRYTEIEYLGKTGDRLYTWVTLNCYRDADAA
jgi:hypothetical protein